MSDVAYLGAGREEKLDIYLPRDASATKTAIVYFHGGGWVRGDKATEREHNIGSNFAGAGYVFVSVNYVLGPKVWPQNLLDCKNAIRFIRQNAASYGVDPTRIVAMGTSAGGHLALMAAYTAGLPEFEPTAPYPEVSSRVAAIIDFYGMTNLLTRQQVRDDGTPLGRPMDSNSPAVLGVTRTENPDRWRIASPVTHVRADSPPTFIAHGLSDATVDYGQAIELANLLRARGVPHDLLLLEGIGHMFSFDWFQEQHMPAHLKPAVLAFLARHVATPPNSAPR